MVYPGVKIYPALAATKPPPLPEFEMSTLTKSLYEFSAVGLSAHALSFRVNWPSAWGLPVFSEFSTATLYDSST